MNPSFRFDTTELFGRVGSGLDLKFVGFLSGTIFPYTQVKEIEWSGIDRFWSEFDENW